MKERKYFRKGRLFCSISHKISRSYLSVDAAATLSTAAWQQKATLRPKRQSIRRHKTTSFEAAHHCPGERAASGSETDKWLHSLRKPIRVCLDVSQEGRNLWPPSRRWAASSLGDRINVRTGPAQENRVARQQHSTQHLLPMEKINQAKRGTGLLWGGILPRVL